MNLSRVKKSNRRGADAYGLPEVVIALVIIATLLVALYAGFSAGFAVMKSARENLRATQILVQRAEVIRLYNWTQIQNTNLYLKPNFVEYYDPLGVTNGKYGVMYVGTMRTNASNLTGTSYSNNVRAVTISLFWTNRVGKTNITFSRQLQTLVARYGMQNYVYGQQ